MTSNVNLGLSATKPIEEPSTTRLTVKKANVDLRRTSVEVPVSERSRTVNVIVTLVGTRLLLFLYVALRSPMNGDCRFTSSSLTVPKSSLLSQEP